MKSPQVFHSKEEPESDFFLFPTNLFAAINNKFNYNEAKILLTLIGCKGDGSFSPSSTYMLKMTGIKYPNHYFATRKNLEKSGYIELDEEKNLYINIDKILDPNDKPRPD